eukprot:scaffold179707_cov34-Tisochrysis_lutea.AAC.4
MATGADAGRAEAGAWMDGRRCFRLTLSALLRGARGRSLSLSLAFIVDTFSEKSCTGAAMGGKLASGRYYDWRRQPNVRSRWGP